jgi:hemolysin activation/secretion protein
MNSYLNTIFIQRVMYEGLGGANSLRGIMRNRVLGNGFAYANIELRTKVAKFDIGNQHFYIGLAPFFDLGVITQPYELDEDKLMNEYNDDTDEHKLSLGDYFALKDGKIDQSEVYMPHMAAGLGLKVAMNENFVFSVDWAMALDKNKRDNAKWANFYIKMGYLF